jgi:adenylate kinase
LQELKKGRAILVTGTPGTGKTTVSRLLAKAVHAKYVNPEILLPRKGIDYTYDERRKTRIVSIRRLRSSLASLAGRTDRGLIIDSHIAFKITSSPRLQRVIVLRCNPAVLERRLKRKHWSKRKISENVLAEILDICLWNAVQNYGWRRISEIDTTDKRPSRVLQLAIRALKERKVRKQPKARWLSSLKHQRLLTHYLV